MWNSPIFSESDDSRDPQRNGSKLGYHEAGLLTSLPQSTYIQTRGSHANLKGTCACGRARSLSLSHASSVKDNHVNINDNYGQTTLFCLDECQSMLLFPLIILLISVQ